MHSADPEPAARPWADLLRGAPDALLVPADLPRPAVVEHELGQVQVPVGREHLDALAAGTGTTAETALLALWVVLLARTADQPDVVLGVDAGSPDQPTVLRVAVDLDADVRAAVAAVEHARAASRALGPVTVQEVLDQLRATPGQDRHPVFQVGFRVGRPPAGASLAPPDAVAPPDLVLVLDPIGGSAVLEHPLDVMTSRFASRVAGHLGTLVTAAAAEPDRAVGTLPLLSEAELEQLRAWNSTSHAHDDSAPLVARVEAQVGRTPDAVAVEFEGTALTYAELWERSGSVAAVLQQRGVGPDVTVAVSFERSVAMVVAVLAVLRAGGAYVPVDPTYPPTRRAVMLADAEVAVVLTSPGVDVPEVAAGVVVVHLDDLGRPHSSPPDLAPCRATGRDLGYVIFTSGSTGGPKGVALPQSALDNLLAWQLRRPQFAAGARTLQFSSLSFDVSFQELFSTWSSGGTLVLVRDAMRRDPLALLDHLDRNAVERLFLPYVALRGLAAAVRSTGRAPSRLREIYTAGEQLQVDPALVAMMEALPEAVLENQYGPSETHVATAHTLSGPPATWPALPPVGRPIDNTEAHVLDDRNQLRPVGIPGELHLGGTCLARGYMGRDELTAERFVDLDLPVSRSTRLYRTGDVARWREDGTLDLLGRRDAQVKFRGFRIEPGEVSATLSGCPGVERCVAAVQDQPGAGPRLTAYLLPAKGTRLDLAAVHAFARAHLPAHMVPSHYAVVEDFPLTSSGKLDVRNLPVVAFDRSILSSPYAEPADGVEASLVEIWRTVLGVEDVGTHDDWFELGGDSLAAAEMVQRVHDALGVELPLGALAQGPTVAQLADVLRAGSERRWRSLVPLRTTGSRTPLFVVHGGSGNVASFPRLARELPDDQPVYALQWDGLDGSRGQRTIPAMAAHYLREVREVQPHGPYLLAGQCIGGLIAREMTRLLLADGERVDLLVMYDSPHLRSPKYTRGRSPFPLDLLVVSNGRKRGLRVVARAALRRPIAPADRTRHGEIAMVRAVWPHDPGPTPPVRTLYFGSGVTNARQLALTGHWQDDLMGWSTEISPLFEVHRIDGEHNEIMYDPAAVSVLVQALDAVADSPVGADEARGTSAMAAG